jgi:hypothetical protein
MKGYKMNQYYVVYLTTNDKGPTIGAIDATMERKIKTTDDIKYVTKLIKELLIKENKIKGDDIIILNWKQLDFTKIERR